MEATGTTSAADLRTFIDGWVSSVDVGRAITINTAAVGNINYTPSLQFATPVTVMDWLPESIFAPVPVGASVVSIDIPIK
jgi:hypothetical protein